MANRERKRIGHTVRFEPSLMRDIKKAAKVDNGRGVGDMIRILVRRGLDAGKAVQS